MQPKSDARMQRILLLMSTALLMVPAHAADPAPDTATGRFTSQGAALDIRSAIAFRGKSFLGGDDALIVAATNARINSALLADFGDRRRAMETRVKDRDTGVVYFEFRPDGSFRGISYYFGPGNGCGFCTSQVESTARYAQGRIAGRLKGTEPGRPFDVTLDVPVLSDDHGAALPADGGAPGAAYLAYHAALVTGDRALVKALLSDEGLQGWAAADKKNDTAGYLRYLAVQHPEKSVRIVKGYARDATALLLISGESTVGKISGEVLLVKERGSWRVNDEVTELELR
jgi:hypothetical protein